MNSLLGETKPRALFTLCKYNFLSRSPADQYLVPTVIAIDTSARRLACARHNAAIYGVQDRIEFIQADFVEWARAYPTQSASQPAIDVVFCSPPWGGLDYLNNNQPGPPSAEEYSLNSLQPIPGAELYSICRELSENVVLYLPRNTSIEEIASLDDNELMEVEEAWMSNKLKALTVYIGKDLA